MIPVFLLAASLVSCPHVLRDEAVATCYEFPAFDAATARREDSGGGLVNFAYRIPFRTKENRLALMVDCTDTVLSRVDYIKVTEGRWFKTADAATTDAGDFLSKVSDELEILAFSRCTGGDR